MEAEFTRAAAYVLVRDDEDRVLLSQIEQDGNPYSGMWTLPGGGMEWGEQAAEAALRELDEETGLSATVGPLIATHSAWFDPGEAFRGVLTHADRSDVGSIFTLNLPVARAERSA